MKLGQTTIQLGKRARFDDVVHRLVSPQELCKVPSLSTGPAVPLTGTETGW